MPNALHTHNFSEDEWKTNTRWCTLTHQERRMANTANKIHMKTWERLFLLGCKGNRMNRTTITRANTFIRSFIETLSRILPSFCFLHFTSIRALDSLALALWLSFFWVDFCTHLTVQVFREDGIFTFTIHFNANNPTFYSVLFFGRGEKK